MTKKKHKQHDTYNVNRYYVNYVTKTFYLIARIFFAPKMS